MTAKKHFPRAILACTFTAAMLLATGAAYAQEAPSLGDLPGADSLSGAELPTALPSPLSSVIDDVLGVTPDPNDLDGITPDAALDGTINSLLPGGVVTDPDPGGNPTGAIGGGSTGGGSTGGTVHRPGAGTGALVPGTTLSGGAGVDPAAIATDAARRAAGTPIDLRSVGGRALRLAAPMAAPVGVAIAGVLGLVMLAKSNGRLDGLEDERKALGGWTVIRL